MAKEFVVNKEKCIGCGVCYGTCPEGAAMEEDGKAKIINSEKLEECGGETICPYSAIEKVGE